MKALQMKSLADAMGAVGANEYFHPWVNRLIPRFSADEFIDQLDENDLLVIDSTHVAKTGSRSAA